MTTNAYHAIRAAKGVKLWGFDAAIHYAMKQGVSGFLFHLAFYLECAALSEGTFPHAH